MKKYNILKMLLGTPFWKDAERYKETLKANKIAFDEETNPNGYGGIYTTLYLRKYQDFKRAWELLGIKPVKFRIKQVEKLANQN